MDGGHPGGGSRGLAQLIDEYGEYLVADLQEVYGVDLRDVFVPKARLTPMYLMTLVRGLPEGSRFQAELRGGQQFRGWDYDRYAAVATINAVRALQYVYVAAHSKSRPKPPASFPVPDEAVKKQSRGPGSFAFIAASKMSAPGKAET